MHVYFPRCGSNHCGYMFVLHDDTFPDKINEENENDNHEKNYK